MKSKGEHAYLFAAGGIHCPLCGGRMLRGALFCGHCLHSGRFHVDAHKVRPESREIYLPRALCRHHP